MGIANKKSYLLVSITKAMQITTMCKYQCSPEFSRFLQPTEYELLEKLLAADFHSIV
jgi:hypothetical protein